jgi:hypothetical protein
LSDLRSEPGDSDQELKIKFSSFVKLPGAKPKSVRVREGKKSKVLFARPFNFTSGTPDKRPVADKAV